MIKFKKRRSWRIVCAGILMSEEMAEEHYVKPCVYLIFLREGREDQGWGALG